MANVLGELFQDIANAIRDKTGATGSMKPLQFPDAISEIEVGSGGVDTEDIDFRLDEINGEVVGQKLCYVTIMSEDGAEQIIRIPVYEGYDAETPFGEDSIWPIKESTNTQVFTFNGFSLTPGGQADASALLDVTGDRTVYLAFKASTRYYTVRFFDGDTLKKTVQVAYDMPASYTLAGKEGWLFRGWEPSNQNITADTDCYAVWEEQLSFADATLAKINEICESGQAADHFAIDDEREITGKDGTAYVLRVVGINVDTKAAGGKAGLTVAITKPGRVMAYKGIWKSEFNQKLGVYWDYTDDPTDESYIRYKLNTDFKDNLPEELQNVMKTVLKRTVRGINTGEGYSVDIRESLEVMFIPSNDEIGEGSSLYPENGVVYPGFASEAQKELYDDTTKTQWHTRTIYITATGTQYVYYYDSSSGGCNMIQYLTTSRGVYPCFCI